MSQNNLHVCCLIYLTFIHPRQIIRLDNSFRYLMVCQLCDTGQRTPFLKLRIDHSVGQVNGYNVDVH